MEVVHLQRTHGTLGSDPFRHQLSPAAKAWQQARVNNFRANWVKTWSTHLDWLSSPVSGFSLQAVSLKAKTRLALGLIEIHPSHKPSAFLPLNSHWKPPSYNGLAGSYRSPALALSLSTCAVRFNKIARKARVGPGTNEVASSLLEWSVEPQFGIQTYQEVSCFHW